jgi:hypothetical protein
MVSLGVRFADYGLSKAFYDNCPLLAWYLIKAAEREFHFCEAEQTLLLLSLKERRTKIVPLGHALKPSDPLHVK